jgi:hypothetical protein
MRLPLSLSRLWVFSACLTAVERARAPPPTSPPPSSPSPRASLPRAGPILRPRAGLPLKGLRLSPFAISFGATRRTRVPSSLRHSVGCCMSAPRLFKRPSSKQPKASLLLPCSQDDRDAHQLCSGGDQLRRLLRHVGGVFPGWDQDRVGIVVRDDRSPGFGCAFVLKFAPPWPKLTPAGLSGSQTGDAEREYERPQRHRQVGGVFPGRDEDCVGIGRQDDQSLGFGCAAAFNSPLLGQN